MAIFLAFGLGYTSVLHSVAAACDVSRTKWDNFNVHRWTLKINKSRHLFRRTWHFIPRHVTLFGPMMLPTNDVVPTNSVSLHTARKIFIYLLTYLLKLLKNISEVWQHWQHLSHWITKNSALEPSGIQNGISHSILLLLVFYFHLPITVTILYQVSCCIPVLPVLMIDWPFIKR